MNRTGLFIALGGWLFVMDAPLRAHDPITTKLTWTREVSRIVYKRCGACHQDGGAAMSLMTYEAARPWAKAMRDEILSRRMPPWGAVKGIGEFVGDPSLSQPETDMMVAWVEGGAPEGDAADLPAHLPALQSRAPALPRFSNSVSVKSETTLQRAVTLLALRPEALREGESLEAWAIQPDGRVERLLWLTDYRRAFHRTYVLAKPLAFPAGTRLRVRAETGAAVFLVR